MAVKTKAKKLEKKATRVADAFKKYPFELLPDDLKLLTEGQIEFADNLRQFYSPHKARRYVENCVKIRKGLCIYCNCADIVKTTPDTSKTRKQKAEKSNPYRYRCKNCKQCW